VLQIQTVDPQIKATEIGELRIRTFKWLLAEHIEPRETLLDLGAGHCSFAKRAREAGYKVTAVDGRTERLPDDLDGIEFVKSDVRELDVTGFGVIAILGLLYHLTLEDQEDLLRRCSYGATVILDTQIHDPHKVGDIAEDWARELTRAGEYEGVRFPERNNPMASIGNPISFWHTEDSLLRLTDRCGYANVTKVEPVYFSTYGARRFYVLTP